MNSRNQSTKKLEREGQTLKGPRSSSKQKYNISEQDIGSQSDKEKAKTKFLGKYNIIQNHRDKFYENLQTRYKENANAAEISGLPKKKKENDIIKKNMQINNLQKQNKNVKSDTQSKPPLLKKKSKILTEETQTKQQNDNNDQNQEILNEDQTSQINLKINNTTKFQKRKTVREQIFEEMMEYMKRPNAKLLKDIRDKCGHNNINFDQIFSKSKSLIIQEKSKSKEENPAGMDQKLAARINQSNKLIQNLQQKEQNSPFNNSILYAAKFNKMRILEALIQYYRDNEGLREQKINEIDPENGRTALHYLAYLGNSDMIQLLAASSQLKFNIIDFRDRTVMHYAAIQGKTNLINTIFLLFKQYGGDFQRANISLNSEQNIFNLPNDNFQKINDINSQISQKSEIQCEGGESEEKQESDNSCNYEEEQISEELEQNISDRKSDKIDQNNMDNSQEDPLEEQFDQQESLNEEKKEKDVDFEEQEIEQSIQQRENEDSQKDQQSIQSQEQESIQSEEKTDLKMLIEMDRSDNHHIDGISFDPFERDNENLGHPQVSMNSILNFRDHKGRTPLHIASIWNNKIAVETLLYLKANPLIEDGGGYRAIDYVDPNSSIADLLNSWMARSKPPQLLEFNSNQGKSQDIIKLKEIQQKIQNKSSIQKSSTNGYELSDLKQLSKEYIKQAKIGEQQDNYMQAVIKQNKIESAIFLKLNFQDGFPLTFQNAIGNTVIHTAILQQNIQILKLLILEKYQENQLQDQLKLNDVKENLNNQLSKCLLLRNIKGLTPFSCAVEQGNLSIFSFILEIYAFIQKKDPSSQVLTTALTTKDLGKQSEPPLIKAIRNGFSDIASSIMQIDRNILKYDEVLCQQDSQGKNALHHAVLQKDSQLVKKLVDQDVDFCKIRSQKDLKQKSPQAYDQQNLFKDIFITIWDAAKIGDTERIFQFVQKIKTYKINEKSQLLENTPLHFCVKSLQVKAVKVLIWELNADPNIKNLNGLTPIDYCKKFVKDKATKQTILGLLNKEHQNIQIDKNFEFKSLKQELRKKELEEIQTLRSQLKESIKQKGYDLAKIFKVFDTNGDGVFDELEFQAAFNVLEIDFKASQLRRLIQLSDKNQDGKIDYNEFHDLLYGDEQAQNDQMLEIIEGEEEDEADQDD